MTNYEKYKDQLMFILMDRIGVDLKKGTPKSCAEVGCKNCCFYIKDDRRCNHRVAEWLTAEAKEPKKSKMNIENLDIETVIAAFFHVARDYAEIAHIHTIHDADGNVYITDSFDIIAMQIMADAISEIKEIK